MQNDYGSLLAPWKMDLALKRARRKGLRPHEIEDAQQDLIHAVLHFKFKPERSNGATEATALTALVDKRLAFIQRGWARQRRREDAYREARGSQDGQPIPDPVDNACARMMPLAFDVRSALPRLNPLEQAVCSRLAHGDSLLHIASSLGLTRFALDRLVADIRQHFLAWDLDSWLGGQ